MELTVAWFCFRPGSQKLAAFGEGKNGHKNFHQVRICYFCDKCVVFVRNCKCANLTQDIYHVIVHLLSTKHNFNPKKFFCPKSSKIVLFWGQQQCFLGKKCIITYFILHIILNQIWKFEIARKNDAFVAKIASNEYFYRRFCPRRKAANSCHLDTGLNESVSQRVTKQPSQFCDVFPKLCIGSRDEMRAWSRRWGVKTIIGRQMTLWRGNGHRGRVLRVVDGLTNICQPVGFLIASIDYSGSRGSRSKPRA